MLLYFSFKNFGPFREENTLDMRAIGAYKEHEYNLYNAALGKDVLKVAVVHGANAAGKSQLVNAYRSFASIVRRSFFDKSENEPAIENQTAIKKYYHPFLFSGQDKDLETEFEAVYIEDDGEYQYGFSYTDEKITSEWLYFTSKETNRRSTILERSEFDLKLGASVRRECTKYTQDIKSETLALSFFSSLSLKSNVFDKTFRCVMSMLALPSSLCMQFISDRLKSFFRYDYSEANKGELLSFLKTIDVGIKDFTVVKTKDDIQVFTHHVGVDGKDYEATLDIESEGTRKVIALYSLIANATKNNKGIIIDELDAQLHPLLLRRLVNLFYQPASGQLIYTAHDTTSLDKKYIRRDQVWIVDKDDKGQSSLYSLAEFKPRNDSSLINAYLSGVYGGIPKIIDAED